MKNRLQTLAFIAGAVGISLSSLGSDLPIVSNVEMVQDTASRLVTITYNISKNPGIITLDIQTNGVSIGAEKFRNALGDVNKENGDRLTFDPVASRQIMAGTQSNGCGLFPSILI